MGIYHHHYILDEQNNHVPEPDIFKYALWDRTHEEQRIIGRTELENIIVSTVFLGINHDFGFGGPPILYETMVFADEEIIKKLLEISEYDDRSIISKFLGGVDIQKRYETREQAIQGHKNMCIFVETCLAKGLLDIKVS